jgi:hypothetical protein
MVPNPSYQALLEAHRMIQPHERQEHVDRALKEIAETEWRDALKERFDALSTARMEQMLGVNRTSDLASPPETPIGRIIAAQKKWRTPGAAE